MGGDTRGINNEGTCCLWYKQAENAALTLSLPFEAACLELDGHNGEREGKVGSETHHLVKQV